VTNVKPHTFGSSGAIVAAAAISVALAGCHAAALVPVNMTPLPAASVAAYVNPAHLPAYTGPTGSVEGTIRIDGPASPENPHGGDFSGCPDGAKMYAKLFREGPAEADGSRALADALVAITGYSSFYLPEQKESQTVKIEDCAFASRTVAMTFGQRLDVANKTPELWSPVLAQAPMPVLMMATSNGDPVHIYPPHPGYFTLTDKGKHPWAIADVYALLHPLHTVSDVAGHYRIDGVPVGKLKVNARLAAIQRDGSTDVEVVANEVAKADVILHYTPIKVPEPVDGGRAGKAHIIP
jgi:hypothetical protein